MLQDARNRWGHRWQDPGFGGIAAGCGEHASFGAERPGLGDGGWGSRWAESEMMGLLPIQLKMGEMINMTLVITGDLELAWERLYVDRRGQKPFMKHFAKLRRISHGCCSGSKQ